MNGAYQDATYSKIHSIYTDAIIVNGFGETSTKLSGIWSGKTGLDSYLPARGSACGLQEPGVDGDFSCLNIPRASNNIRHNLAASFLTQQSLYADMLGRLSLTKVTNHHTYGLIFGEQIIRDNNSVIQQGGDGPGTPVAFANSPYISAADSTIFLDVRPSITVSLTKEDSYSVQSVKRSFASISCLLYTSPSPRDRQKSRMPSSA